MILWHLLDKFEELILGSYCTDFLGQFSLTKFFFSGYALKVGRERRFLVPLIVTAFTILVTLVPQFIYKRIKNYNDNLSKTVKAVEIKNVQSCLFCSIL